MHDIPAWAVLQPVDHDGSRLSRVSLYVYVSAARHGAGARRALPGLYQFLLNKWYFDELYDFLFVRPAFGSAACSGRAATAASSTGSAPTASRRACVDGARLAVRLQTGYIYHYAFAMLIGVAAIITWFVVGGVR